MDGGFPDDQLATDDDGVGRAGGGRTAELFEEAAGGLFAHFFTGIVDRGELGLDYPRDGVIVKSYDGHVFGYAETGFPDGLKEYGGKKVIGYKDAVGACFHL